MAEVLLAELIALAVEFIGEALQEQHAEDEFLELRGIHLAAQDVRCFKEKGFELGEGDLFRGQNEVLETAIGEIIENFTTTGCKGQEKGMVYRMPSDDRRALKVVYFEAAESGKDAERRAK